MLYEASWPVDQPRANVVIAHGIAEHVHRYEHVAAALNDAGYSVRGRDMRGHGRSAGFPTDMGAASQLVDDLAETVGDGDFLYAHSFGTLVALPVAARTRLRGLVLSGIAIVPTEETMMSFAAGSISAETVSRDAAVVQAYIDDPYVRPDEIVTPSLATMLDATAAAVTALPDVTCPVLIVHGGADRICSVDGARQAYDEIGSADKTLKIYEGLYHEVHNEPERAAVLTDVCAWLDGH